MSHFLDRLTFFRQKREPFSNGHGVLTNEDRKWENAYRSRWSHDKIARSTHGVNCTGSCSWKIYVKNGIITWETQQTDYPRTRPDLPNHEPRGCPRGASYSWYVYSAQRIKYPMMRGALAELWREARKTKDPIEAWKWIVEDPERSKSYKSQRGLGGFVRSNWDEAYEMVAAANCYTIKKYGPDRVIGFSPIPAMSMISYAAGARYLGLIGGVPLSFYDWYCDLPPASPQTWGEQTDVAESADWYNSNYLLVWGSNIPMTRTPDAHFYTEVRYKGTKTVAVSSDFGEMAKFSDIWLAPRQGTDAALAMAMGHVILKEFHIDNPSDYFQDYCRRLTDMPVLVCLKEDGEGYRPEYTLRASHLSNNFGEEKNPDWKVLAWNEKTDSLMLPNGSIGFRWDGSQKWNLETKAQDDQDVQAALSLKTCADDVVRVGFDYFGGEFDEEKTFRKVPVKRITLADGSSQLVATVFDLLVAQYGVDNGLGDENVAKDYFDDKPYTPKWQEKHTGVAPERVIQVAREFAQNAHDTKGRSMIIVGAGLNHWYYLDMNYRGLINMLMMCGTIGKSGGGWCHYVGQEKLRPQSGWAPLTFALDWHRPARQMAGTSFFYGHTGQYRHETVSADELLTSDAGDDMRRLTMIDYNAKAARMGWTPSAPQLETNPLDITDAAEKAGMNPVDYTVKGLKDGTLEMSCDDPENPKNWPRNMFIWRSNILGSSGKGHEYFLKYLLGTQNGLMSDEDDCLKPAEVKQREGVEGKLDLFTLLDFRMNPTCLYADVIFPTATWYEKHDLNTSDMHPFIHPFTEAVQPLWQSKSDWEIYKGLAKKFSELAKDYLGVRKDIVLTPLMHDSPQELGQPFDPKDWKLGECEPIPGKTMPAMTVVERDYGAVYEKFTSIGPLLEKVNNNGKGMAWDTKHEVDFLRKLNGVQPEGAGKGQPRIETAIDAAEMVLTLAPETNGHVSKKAWQSLGKITGRDHTHLINASEHTQIRFRDIVAQPRKIVTSPIWSGVESEEVCYTAGYTNVHELIPWRTLTGRQQFYQDHKWMRDFGAAFCVYRPAVDTKTTKKLLGKMPNGNPEITLNFLTPHQKWGIHSTYSENLRMLTLGRGGPHVWISEIDAKKAGLVDNDWVEVFNTNGSIACRVIVSQRIPETMILMYHAQEKLVHTPAAETTKKRGGIHNSVTKAVLNPTHMIGGYAQLAYSFNYYGTVGSNRDEWVIVRKMKDIDWMDEPADQA
ncbi:nitrate reductase subunit alpha [Eikenella sp. HMSC061C02]|uniref:nitrate reductase subunit alpha n=1 Tax=Eikenella sp. HMSC061C02 TaxID=1715021 RepID=UPI0008A1E17C|nr:nitrate reductase subunit alpha [Eikenella sp. HMSC061C02]OFN62324.1 nitrate reductase subunit alpha [Eikenella sp. HMSC061C02]